ncbi:hypothetical protein [Brevundimonas sp.]|uniref:hypothetical protein n=1 Tax=Brevundimonas sp. TaxID=1871086 RepID=UPI003566F2F9
MTSIHRLEGVRAYGRAADAFETVAWRAPSATRFDARVANDVGSEQEVVRSGPVGHLPAWLTITAGGVAAALLGALLGGALQV